MWNPRTLLVAGTAATIVLLGCSDFFSSSEIASSSLPREWIDERAAGSDRRAAISRKPLDDPTPLLVTLLVGNTVVNVASSSIAIELVASSLPTGSAVVVTTALTSTLVLIFGAIVPKSCGLGNAERWALSVAVPGRLVERALSPLIALVDGVTRRMSALIGADPAIEAPYVDE